MSFEKGDRVLFHDKHSDHDGEVGEIEQVSETMFGDETYSIAFDEGKEHGIPADSLEAAPESDEDEESESETGEADTE